ncbi:hypothetical protein [Mycoplasmoides alvi]|uniref:hypothetical protein n=1 Tax=Mycoplasmoides alvi TaxID=78580 RepID=UPI000ACC5417|nr:hypothetical protein [Mycoplasmoides alvi]
MNNKDLLLSKLYTKFSDEEDFIPDNGNQQKLAEVFTPKLVVDLMLKNSGLKNDSNFMASVFEPGCGTGNFTIEILAIKLEKVFKYIQTFASKQTKFKEYLINSLLALASITFLDIDLGNVKTVKNRLFKFMIKKFNVYMKILNLDKDLPKYYELAINSILHANGICANLLDKEICNNLLIVRYARNKDWIGRYVYKFIDLLNINLVANDQYNLFSEDDFYLIDPEYEDEIKYNKWTLLINGKDIFKKNSSLKKVI